MSARIRAPAKKRGEREREKPSHRAIDLSLLTPRGVTESWRFPRSAPLYNGKPARAEANWQRRCPHRTCNQRQRSAAGGWRSRSRRGRRDGFDGEAPAGREEVPGAAAVRGRRRRRPPQHRQVRAEVLRSVPRSGRVLRFCSGWVPRPPAQRLRDRHLHVGGRRDARRLRGPPRHDQGRRRAVDDGRARHRALGDAGGARHVQGSAALGQPLLQQQNDRARVPGDPAQGHREHDGGRRDGARDRGAVDGRAVAGAHEDADAVPGLHGAPARRGAAARVRVVERVRVRAGGRGRVRERRQGGAPPPAAPRPRRRRRGVERVG